ncbi:MAG: M23 family metallopeptidase, partial [Ferruginibacter sp.]
KQMTAKQRQMKKVSNAIAAAIKKAQDDARKEAIARAKAIEKKNKETPTPNVPKTKPDITKKVDSRESVLLNSENIELNASFERNRGSLPWPVDNGYVLMHYGNNKLPSGGDMVITCTSIASTVGTPVKVIFDGEVLSVNLNDEQPFVVIQHGKYFTTYTNLNGINVSKGQSVKRGQVIGRVATNYDGDGSMDFYMSTETGFVDPERWLRRK